MPSNEFRKLVENSTSIGDILKNFDLQNKGGNSNTVKRRIKYENIDRSHITLGKGSNKGRRFAPKKSDSEFFCESSNTNRHHIKKRIIKNKLVKKKLCSLILSFFFTTRESIFSILRRVDK